MNFKTLVVAVGVVAPFCVLGFMFFAPATDQVMVTYTNFDTVDPGSERVVDQLALRTLRGQDGIVIEVRDFINESTTTYDQQNYTLVGGLDSNQDVGYAISYFAPDDFFSIAISAEPIFELRAQAEQELISLLGVSEAVACGIRVHVGTSVSVNQAFAGENLGLSFCPGSVTIE